MLVTRRKNNPLPMATFLHHLLVLLSQADLLQHHLVLRFRLVLNLLGWVRWIPLSWMCCEAGASW